MRDPELIARAKHMRQNPTPAEARLWNELRAKRFAGHKFRHQNVIVRYIADFACRHPMLIIEVDGDTHGDQERYDAKRTAALEAGGYTVLRFTNADVMTNIEGVLWQLGDTLKALSPSGDRKGRSEATARRRAVTPQHPPQTPPLPDPLP